MTESFAPCLECSVLNKIDIAKATAKTPVCAKCKTPLPFKDGVIEVSSDGLEKLIQKSPLPVVVDFWAEWCGPCKMFAPTYRQVALKNQGQYVFAKLDTESQTVAAQRHQIRSIPTLALFALGKELKRQSGALPASVFEEWIRL